MAQIKHRREMRESYAVGRALRQADAQPAPSRKYAYCSDTAYSPEIIPFIRNVDVLYHEATFAEADAVRAQETFHSTARQAAEIARAANVKKLIIGHFSSRYTELTRLLDEARSVFENTHLAVEGLKIEL